ncbi:hypothetical protein SAMN00017405_0544 [Desulfonispora thiosulfatigenes DSM 11270]|uniref:Uncharacterized protein n=1 Tax=Desulfonispora thiosulfatigenes DSM 11270 TaxID=656914 RepID=A0A1W1V6X0_DESTI|nr:hypothetical protein [Desulfonispora thiosulfatigenes]SMB88900.1 hypothetical protein SAMN00017405_0544 [Desulfonispora thiosulfatigenes DSM 11270]
MMKLEISENSANYFEREVKNEFNWSMLFLMPFKYLFNALIAVCLAWFFIPVFIGAIIFGIFGIFAWFITKTLRIRTKERKHTESSLS